MSVTEGDGVRADGLLPETRTGLSDTLSPLTTLSVLIVAMSQPESNPYSSPQTMRAGRVPRTVFWTVAIATFVVIGFLPTLMPGRDGSSPPIESTSMGRIVVFFYFLDRPMHRAGYGADKYQLPVNLATVCLWSFVFGFATSRVVMLFSGSGHRSPDNSA